MAAFSYQQHTHHPFLLDQSPDPTNHKFSGDHPTTAVATCLVHDQGGHHSKTKNLQSPGSSISMVLDDGQLAIKRKKDNIGISFNSAQSQDTRKGKRKKQKKSNDDQGAVGYIHVRARRGQATDSHSLAERVRREKISEKMKFLQSIVPGCDKVTGKSLMLDQIINYVQSLQNQVEFLSMKLATASPMFYDFGVGLDAFMLKPHQNMIGNMVPSVQQCNIPPNIQPLQWGLEKQRQKCDDPFGLGNNSFH